MPPKDDDPTAAQNANPSSRQASRVALISDGDLRKIWEAVQRAGKLRDQCLFMALLTGVAANELKVARPLDVLSFRSVARLNFRTSKQHAPGAQVHVTASFLGLADAYIQEAGLNTDDYLFPSPDNPTVPMSSQEMSTILLPYLSEVLPASTQMTTHDLSKSVAANAKKLMGHVSPKTTLAYISELTKPSAARAQA